MRQPRSDVTRNRRLLVEATIESFHDHGLDVPLDTVARRAGVGNATLYRHFPTRDDLYEEGAVRADVDVENLALLVDALRPVVAASANDAPELWHRHLVLVLDALRPGAASPLLFRLADVEQRLRLTRTVHHR